MRLGGGLRPDVPPRAAVRRRRPFAATASSGYRRAAMSSAFNQPPAKLRFPSEEWCAAYKDAINANPGYKTAAKDWTHGPVAYVLSADPSIGIAEDMAMWLDLDRGECKGCRLVSPEQAQSAAFVIVASYSRWKEVIHKELDATKGMMQNKLKLAKGHMPTIVKFVTSTKELVESATRVPTQFVDE